MSEPAVALDSGYRESHGTESSCPERMLWAAVIGQAGLDLFNADEQIRADAIGFFRGPDLLRVVALAGLSRDDAAWLRSRALELAEVSPERRQRRTRRITYRGETHSLKGWAEAVGIDVTTLSHRLSYGWPLAQALSTPAGSRRQQT